MDSLSQAMVGGEGVRALTYLLILILIGVGAEWLYWTYAWGPLRGLESQPPASRREALRLGTRRAAYLGTGLLVFTVASIASSAAFTWPPGVHETVVAATLFVVVLRLAWIGVNVLAAPGPVHRAAWRLVPLAQRQVRPFAALAMGIALMLALARFVPDLLEQLAGAGHLAGAVRLVVASVLALLLCAAALLLAGGAAPGAKGRRRLPRFPRVVAMVLMVIAVYLLWLLGAATAAAIAAIVAIVAVVQMGLRSMVFFFWEEDIAAEGPTATAADAASPRAHATAGDLDPGLVPSIVLSLARFLVVMIGLGACALVLHAPMGELTSRQNALLRVGLEVLGVAALALFTLVVWIIIRTSIDHRLKRIGPYDPQDPHSEPNANSRLLTLLPLLRTTAAVLLLVMLVLSALWALGIEITPLLAGAGVVGFALGFGAQALVRDIIAGIFFLAEDVFRVGEYIESGTTTKGTVGRITLRTVALRHHNGQLLFVPYGSLGTVRNNSRDWVIEKFNLPLPVEVDSEKIRKLIKKIGVAMLDDPDVGHMLRQPLKGKLYRIDPGVKILRCKFETAPGNQFDVRAQAIRRIEAELKAIGVGFATGGQTVIVERLAEVPAAAPGCAPTDPRPVRRGNPRCAVVARCTFERGVSPRGHCTNGIRAGVNHSLGEAQYSRGLWSADADDDYQGCPRRLIEQEGKGPSCAPGSDRCRLHPATGYGSPSTFMV
ncbi:MAG: mechanosensitive ion channel [Betaproteobacteria bacterium]|nr:mechanosensitive ion channel [Betaproteobacteria bacterium]